MLPFAAIAIFYVIGSEVRLSQNAADKLMPALSSMWSAWSAMALEIDTRSGGYLFWVDTGASLLRMGLGLAIATIIALAAGVAIGMLPYARSTFGAWCDRLVIPALSILTICSSSSASARWRR